MNYVGARTHTQRARPIVRDTPICVCDALIYNDDDTLIHIIRDTIICVRDAIICVRDALIYNDGDTLIHNVQT